MTATGRLWPEQETVAENDRCVEANRSLSLSRQVTELLELIRLYHSQAVAQALVKAHAGRAFGADYVANILRQQLAPRAVQPFRSDR